MIKLPFTLALLFACAACDDTTSPNPLPHDAATDTGATDAASDAPTHPEVDAGTDAEVDTGTDASADAADAG